MKTELPQATFLALVIASAVYVFVPVDKVAENQSMASSTERLRVAAISADGYVAMPSHPSGGSILCRLPIRIANWNIVRLSRCN